MDGESYPSQRSTAAVVLSLNGADACTARRPSASSQARSSWLSSRKNPAMSVSRRFAQMPSVHRQQHVARLQQVPAADRHLGNRRIAAETALDEVAHRVSRQFFLGDLAFAQQQLDVAVIAGALEDLAVTQVVHAAVADVRPVRRAFLDQADRPSWRAAAYRCVWPLPSFATSSCARLSDMCRKPSGSNIGSDVWLERLEQALQRGVRGAAAVGVTAHAVDDDQQRGLVRAPRP